MLVQNIKKVSNAVLFPKNPTPQPMEEETACETQEET